MFKFIKRIYLIGIDEDSVLKMKAITPSFIELAYSDKLQKKRLDRADFVVAKLNNEESETLMNEMRAKESLNSLILCPEGQEFSRDYSDVLDIWHYTTLEELLFRYNNLIKYIQLNCDYFETKEALDTILEASDDMIWIKDINGRHVLFNQVFLDTLPQDKTGHKKTMEECLGRGHLFLWEISSEEYKAGEYVCMESELDVMSANKVMRFDEILKVSDGEMRNLMTKKAPIHDENGKILGTLGIARDVTQELKYKNLLQKRAYVDELTGLYNRGYMYDIMKDMRNKEFSVLYMDLDNFKGVNDNFGHQKGDEALILTAKTLQYLLSDFIVGRTGGDEFIALGTGEKNLEEISSKIENTLIREYKKDESFDNLGISIGYAVNSQGRDVDKIIHEADQHMYDHKIEKKEARN